MKVISGWDLSLRLSLVAVLTCLWSNQAAAQEKEPQPNKDLKPVFGSEKLKAGFTPDPYRKDLIAGGKLATKLGGVSAWVDEAPDFVLDYTTDETLKYPLTIYADSRDDTTLLIQLPDGKWVADDDSGGNLNPLIKFGKPQPGRYSIWVGTLGKNAARATLYITERPWIPRELVPREKDILFEISSRQLDKILKDLKIAHDESDKGIMRWKVGANTVALERYYDGKAMVIGVNLTDYTNATLEQINKWNDDEALSRAILRTSKDGKSKYARLESDLNCELGVTPKSVDLFIKRFNQSLDKFKKFLKPEAENGGEAQVEALLNSAMAAQFAGLPHWCPAGSFTLHAGVERLARAIRPAHFHREWLHLGEDVLLGGLRN